MTAAIQVKTWLAGDFTKSQYWKKIRPDGTYGLDVDGYYGGQCMDLIMAYGLDLFGWRPTGNAINLLSQPMPAGWKRSKTPIVGAIAVKDFVSGGKNYGHTYIVTAVIDSGAKVQTLEQNAGADWSLEYGSAPHRYTRFASEATTYLIPPIGGSDMIEDTQRHYDIINREWINSTGREFTWKEFRVNFVGKDKLEALLIIHSSPETAKWQKLATLGQKADKEGWVKPTESDKKLVQIKKIIG